MESGQGDMLSARTAASLDTLMARLTHADPSRLADVVAVIGSRLHELVAILRPSQVELRLLLDFLAEVGHHTDARRHEFLLLADVLGISSAVDDIHLCLPPGATPSARTGPFYRPDAPLIAMDGTLSRDGKGAPLAVSGQVVALDGRAIGGAQIEVWHANDDGLYENQEPDLQPEFNLRGRLVADAQGRFRFRTIKPGGYRIPTGGPVAALLSRLGLPLDRPAHISFRVTAKGYRTLTTHIFDQADPAIGRDAIFGVKPELLAEFRAVAPQNGCPGHALDFILVLCPEEGSTPPQQGRSIRK